MSPSRTPPASTRRQFIRLFGGGAVLAATAPLAACDDAMPEAATDAWRTAAAQADLRRFMLAHALLAPNPHNRQPWLADLSVPDAITLVCDGERLLPHTDPFGRQILIGCGAFIELAVIAASQRGVAVTVEAFPDGAPADRALPAGTRVARLRLGRPGEARPDALFAHIERRHTNKSAYANDRPLDPALLQAWAGTAARFGLRSGVVHEPARLAGLRRIAREAYEIECVTDRTWLESAHLMRIGPQAIARHRDGIALNGAFVRAMHAAGLFDPLEVPRRGSSQLSRVLERWAPFETGSGFLWLASDGNARSRQLDAGRAYVRMHLQATAAGADLHPLSQALQEFDEMRALHAALHRALGFDAAAQTVQMFVRAGYAQAPSGPSPRRGLGSMLQA